MNVPKRPRSKTVIAAIVLALSLLSTVVTVVLPAEKEADALSTFDTELLNLLNDHRRNLGLNPFVEWAPLSQASLNWSNNMLSQMGANACRPGFEHDSNANIASQGQPPGTSPAGWSENIACAVGSPGVNGPGGWTYANMPTNCPAQLDYSTPLLAFCGWINSTGHRTTIENPAFTHIGVGTAIEIRGGVHKPVSTTRFSDAPVVSKSQYVPVNPTRLLDTRFAQGPWTPGHTRTVDVTGVGPLPAAGVDAVVLNITTVSPNTPISWLTVSPTGEAAGTTAVHNFGTATYTTMTNNDLIVAKVGAAGTIDIRNHAGSVHLVIDVVGYYTKTGGYGYQPVTAARLIDTRIGTPFWSAGETRQVDVTGVGPLPANGVKAVVLNVTTASPSAPQSWLTIFPTGEAPGTTAALNFGQATDATATVNDLVVAKVGANGTISIKNAHGNVHLIIDVVGYYSSAGGHGYSPLNPRRILDTRNTTEGQYSTPWTQGMTRTVNTGLGGCARAAVMHVTTVNPTASFSWLTASAAGTAAGTTASSTFGLGAETSQIANDVFIVPTNAAGNVNIFNALGNVDLVVDLVGSYGTC